MSQRFQGKTAIVTGTSRGIGLAIAERLVAEGGAKVVITARAKKARDEAVGSADLLVNNTGINAAYGPMVELDLGAARKTPRGELHRGTVVGAAGPSGLDEGARRRRRQRLDHRAAGRRAEPGDIRVNAVAPAVVKTQFTTALYEGRKEKVAAQCPLRRLGVPEDIGSVVAFLLSQDAAWMTGQTVVVDGGVTLAVAVAVAVAVA